MQNFENSKNKTFLYNKIPREYEEVGKKIVDAAYHVHKEIGPGLLEKVYEVCFCHEL
jgi:hypothetical protein